MIGKGYRLQSVKDAIIEYGGIYLGAIGGAGAMMSSCIKKCEITATGIPAIWVGWVSIFNDKAVVFPPYPAGPIPVLFIISNSSTSKMALIEKGEKLPLPLEDQVIFYVGPTPSKPGKVFGK